MSRRQILYFTRVSHLQPSSFLATRRGFFEGWFEWPSFRTEAFRRRDDRDRQDLDTRYTPDLSRPPSSSSSSNQDNDPTPLFDRKAKDVWESIKKDKDTTPPPPPPPSSSGGNKSGERRQYSTCVIKCSSLVEQRYKTSDENENKEEDERNKPQQQQEKELHSEELPKELYKCDQALTIRAMGAMGGFNVLFWGQYLASALLFEQKSITVQGVEITMAGDPMWGYVGVLGTGMILYSTYMFATHAVNRAYLTNDKQRIGFQIHNVWGNPGRIMEVKLGLATMITMPGLISKNSSYIPVKIEGKSKNVILDEAGTFEHDRELLKLLEESKESLIQSKEERKNLGRGGVSVTENGKFHRYNQRNNRKRQRY